MSVKRTLALRAAAVIGSAGLALGLGGACAAAVAAPVPASAFGVLTAGASTSVPVVARASVATGSQSGGTVVTLVGTDLSTSTPGKTPDDDATLSTPTVTFSVPGATKDAPITATVDPEDVTVLSTGVVRVITPEIAAAGKASITVKDGDDTSVKAPAFTFTAAVPTVTDKGLTGAVTSELGGDITIKGEYLGDAKTTKVYVGGKAAPVKTDDGSTVVATAPPGLASYQDVVVTTKGGAVDAGVLTYTATVPQPAWGDDGYTISTQKGASLAVTGTDLQNVTSGTFTAAGGARTVIKVTQPTAVEDKGKGKKLALVLPAKLTEGKGTLVLNTPYASSEAAAVTVVKAGTPTLTGFTDDSAAKVGKAGGTVVLKGTNLNYISSVKLGSSALTAAVVEEGKDPASGYAVNDDATEITVVVPAQTKSPAQLALTVTTDGGATKAFTIPVSDTALDKAATYDTAKKTITLTGKGLAGLSGIKVADASSKVLTATFTADGAGTTSVSKALTAAPADGIYTVSATDASGLTFTAGFTVDAPSTVTAATYDAKTRVLTVTGTKLTSEGLTLGIKDAKGAAVDVGDATFSGSATSRTLTLAEDDALARGSYTVEATADSKSVASKDFTVASLAAVTKAVSASVAATDPEDDPTGKVTLTGTGLVGLSSVTVSTGTGDDATSISLTAAQSGNTATSWVGTSVEALVKGSSYTLNGYDANGVDIAPLVFTAS